MLAVRLRRAELYKYAKWWSRLWSQTRTGHDQGIQKFSPEQGHRGTSELKIMDLFSRVHLNNHFLFLPMR
jgi:hypothetical protein